MIDAMKAESRGGVRARVWALVLAGVLAFAGIAGLTVRAASADPTLPPLTPSELLGKVAAARVAGLSATFEQRSDLGLPALPAGVGDDETATMLSLLTGTHTIRVWTAGEQKSKVALVDGSAESAEIRNGGDVWVWSSETQEAVHSTLPATKRPTSSVSNPTEAIRTMLSKLNGTTEVTTSGTGYVAGRAVYQLILTPRATESLIGQVRVSIDAENFVPLALKVFADDGQEAVGVQATSVDFTVPNDSIFAFQPPAGVTVTERAARDKGDKPSTGKPKGDAPKIYGTGWATIAVLTMPTTTGTDQQQAKAVLDSLPAVSGSWGKGRLLSTTLLTAVITDDGRVAVGAVVPDALYRALGSR